MKKILAKLLVLCMVISMVPTNLAMAAEMGTNMQPRATDEEVVAETKNNLTIPNSDDIRGNITLPAENAEGVIFEWSSSQENVISTRIVDNGEYDSTPAGTVTRGNTDQQVVLTAQIIYGTVKDSKQFTVTVKAASDFTEESLDAYVFAYFKGEGLSNGEQIYFATSQDGLHWEDMNNGDPAIISDLGEKGLRDPFVIRAPEGDKFYLIATDLKINGGRGWGLAQSDGSQSIMIWESTDLVNWTDQRMVKVALDTAGCTWAPEAFYDEKTGEYIVFWASKTSADNYSTQRIYYSKTRDFYTFTEAQVWTELNHQVTGAAMSIIDTSVISVKENDGSLTYYRFSKNEADSSEDGYTSGGKYTILETSKSLLGEWTRVDAEGLKQYHGVEGGTSFKFNGKDEWCLLLDNHGNGGYFPLSSTDLSSGEFTRLDTSEYYFPSTMRHGTVLAVTQEEYNAFTEKWTDSAAQNTETPVKGEILSYNFEEVISGDSIADSSGNGFNGKLVGNAAYVQDSERGQVLYLDGTANTYAAFPQGFFDGRNNVTISMDIKAEKAYTSGDNFFTFGFGQDSNKYIFLKTMDTRTLLSLTTGSSSGEQTASGTTESINGNWINITMVITTNKISIYKDGALLAEQQVASPVARLGNNTLAYLGKSFYSADGYFNGYFDNVKVYNRALSAGVIAGTAEYTVEYQASAGGSINGTSIQIIESGGSTGAVTAVAEKGYAFIGWSDGVATARRTDDSVTADKTVTALFEREFTLQYKADTGGKINGKTTQTVVNGQTAETVTAVADKGYVFTKWSDGITTAARTDSNVTADKTVTAQFTRESVIPDAAKVTLNKKSITLGKKEPFTLIATVAPQRASQTVTWKSNKPSVVSVNKGKLTAKRTGTAKITATTGNGKTVTCTVTVKKAPNKVKFTKAVITLKRGKTTTLNKKLKLPAGTASYSRKFTSAKKKIVKVLDSSTGKIKAVSKGTVTIKVKTFNGKSATIKVKVI